MVNLKSVYVGNITNNVGYETTMLQVVRSLVSHGGLAIIFVTS